MGKRLASGKGRGDKGQDGVSFRLTLYFIHEDFSENKHEGEETHP